MKKTVVGRISKLFGADGELMMSLYDEFPQKPDITKPFYAIIDSLDVPLFLEHFDRRGRTSAVVRFADIDNQRRASEFTGKELFVAAMPEKAKEKDKELYLNDIVGYTAHLGEGASGRIDDFVDSDLNPLFSIILDGQQVLIPATDDFIEKIDERRRQIWFSLPEGLLTVNDK